MTVTREQVIDLLLPIEPDFTESSATVGTEVLPYLREFIAGEDIHLAAQAASFAGFIKGDEAVDVVRFAASHHDPRVRTAAAGGSRNLTGESAMTLIAQMLTDDHDGVRKLALQAVPANPSTNLRQQIETIGENDQNPELRALAARVLEGDH